MTTSFCATVTVSTGPHEAGTETHECILDGTGAHAQGGQEALERVHGWGGGGKEGTRRRYARAL
jgi:hypothetical protein